MSVIAVCYSKIYSFWHSHICRDRVCNVHTSGILYSQSMLIMLFNVCWTVIALLFYVKDSTKHGCQT